MYHVLLHMSCLVHGLHGVWCLFFFRDGMLAHWVTHSVGVSLRTQGKGQGPHRLVLSTPLTLFAWLRALVRLTVVHVGWYTKLINEGLRSLWANPKSITSKCMGRINVC